MAKPTKETTHYSSLLLHVLKMIFLNDTNVVLKLFYNHNKCNLIDQISFYASDILLRTSVWQVEVMSCVCSVNLDNGNTCLM